MPRQRKPRPPRESEKDFQKWVTDNATLLGWKWAHFRDSRRQIAPGQFVGDVQAAGFPDLVLVKDQLIYMVEIKKQSGKLTSAQEEWQAVLAPTPVIHEVWRPSDRERILYILSGDKARIQL